eukprot:6197374-Pyramimonas_sp.AAC.1
MPPPSGPRRNLPCPRGQGSHGHCKIDHEDLIKPSYHSQEDSILPQILHGRQMSSVSPPLDPLWTPSGPPLDPSSDLRSGTVLWQSHNVHRCLVRDLD